MTDPKALQRSSKGQYSDAEPNVPRLALTLRFEPGSGSCDGFEPYEPDPTRMEELCRCQWNSERDNSRVAPRDNALSQELHSQPSVFSRRHPVIPHDFCNGNGRFERRDELADVAA